jgi:hypothetical protein
LIGFIKEARKGAYQYDYKDGMEGLKIIKHYFKFIQKEFDPENYNLAKVAYKKLIFFLFETGYDYFNYEDIIDRSKLNFEKVMTNYFTCLIKLCTVKELFNEYFEYIKEKKEYYFEAADKTIIDQLNKDKFNIFESLVYKKDYYENDLIYFLLDLAKRRNDRAKYNSICDEFKDVIDEAEDQKKYFDKDE